MRLQLLVIVALLATACVARSRPTLTPIQAGFENDWQQARDWSDAIKEWTDLTSPATAHPHCTALFGPEHADKPGLVIGELVGVGNPTEWRERKVLAKTYSATFAIHSPTGDFGKLALPDVSYAWRLPSASKLGDGVLVSPNGGGLLRAAGPWIAARVVFRLNAEPTPTNLYSHGTEVLVASWGVSLEPLAIELTGENGDQAWLFLNESGPG